MTVDPVHLTQSLVRCRSVTPAEGGALVLLDEVLSEAGFACTRVDRGGVANLFARWGPSGHRRTLGFNGHTDVVPTGDPAAWSADPFCGALIDGSVFGRGSVDMKSGVAAFVAAATAVIRDAPPDGALILAITGDEEGPATDGTRALLDWMAENGEAMTACIVGEPTSAASVGDTVKIGRRGSLTARITVAGRQGHSAYPDRALNPLPPLVRLLDRLAGAELDAGTAHFAPSTLALTTIDTGNPAQNVIPGAASAGVNIRFNDIHSGESLVDWLHRACAAAEADSGVGFALDARISGEAFVTEPGPFTEQVADAIATVTGARPAFSTTGGTSDARFVKDHCPVVELGLVGRGLHEVDEAVPASDIEKLAAIYAQVLRGWFG
ncbi:MAG TPA: succinyl-diaminopimelate desuccinylase [Rhodobacteraceae bacterium]|jgi:succinyl-diaminopimelate desuccinylase|nr:succinyl-diaminopimelate desuccinylase [Paracoccaceae bacterium]HBG98355.1 succinyl-diaminopimelate desuccinylase [Paracoccaceae bacterium]